MGRRSRAYKFFPRLSGRSKAGSAQAPERPRIQRLSNSLRLKRSKVGQAQIHLGIDLDLLIVESVLNEGAEACPLAAEPFDRKGTWRTVLDQRPSVPAPGVNLGGTFQRT